MNASRERPAAWLAMAADVSAPRHRALERELAEERAAHRALLRAISDAVFELDREGTICECTALATQLTGLSRERLLGARLGDLLAPTQRETFAVLLVRALGGPQSGDFDLVGPEGVHRGCGLSLHLSRTTDEGVRLRAVIRDLSAQHLFEEQQRRAAEIASHRERLATIGQLAAGVAHEINNPLAFIKSNLSTLGSLLEEFQCPDAEVKEEARQMVAESLDGTDRIRQIVEALRSTARQKAHESIEFDPGRSIAEALTVFRGAHRSTCTVNADLAPLPPVLGSPGALGQVLLNLMQNGLDAMGGKGCLAISAQVENDEVVLRVTDLGPGIPAEVQKSLFLPFFTTKAVGVGTGLGLYICRQLVDELRGRLEFDTGPAGTTFTITLPLADPDESV